MSALRAVALSINADQASAIPGSSPSAFTIIGDGRDKRGHRESRQDRAGPTPWLLPVDRLRQRAGAGGRGRLARARSGDLLALARRRRLEVAALALDGGERAAVEIVDVAPHLQLAGVVDEGGLVGQVDPDRGRLNLQVMVGGAVHGRDALAGQALVRA